MKFLLNLIMVLSILCGSLGAAMLICSANVPPGARLIMFGAFGGWLVLSYNTWFKQ